ncbi:MAG: bifunctional 4-hydroxy-3-methylbut-2-enyl diphosphate reductase/30S ribosomal protein S1 [Lachnospiraceae bacterium]|nr:bifunctional 4-hydroxy-3-methylbut-2-enyl diphosphate reductase/30S ribosomal protein S1 [Lachnospiraceae bacterium]
MEITVAKTAGFCFGVKRAVDMVYEQADKGKVYTYGPIIHNEEVIEDLKKHGVEVIETIDDINGLSEGSVVIRSHGVGKDVYDAIENKGLTLVDATCPFVKKIHDIVYDESNKGKVVLIIGSKNHAEVEGIKGWCVQEPIIIESEEEAYNINLPEGSDISVVSQTTFNENKFKHLLEILKQKGYNLNVYNTICNATHVRQEEASSLAASVDHMIVIGGKHSSNTQKLYDICKGKCGNTYYIQTLVDLDLTAFESAVRVGITAGASTPNYIIKEVLKAMSEEKNEFEQLLSEEKPVTVHNGQVVEGTVISVKEDEIVLNIGYKADGIITRAEYSNVPSVDLTEAVKVGDTMSAKVIKVNDGEGQVLLSYKRVAAEKANERLEEAFNNQEVLKAKVTQVVDGGISVTVGEGRVFIPASLVSDTYERDLKKYMDQEVEFIISEFNPKKRRIIGNRKQILVERKAEAAKALFDRISVGDTVTGKVKNITDFGAFIDLGGADGLLHISEMSWGRVENPKKVFKVDDEVTAFIKDINGSKIALSLKFPEKNPWNSAAEKYAIGQVVTGRVARMTDFGAFIELEPGVDALLHVSQIAREHIEKPSDVLKVNETVEAKVVDFKLEDKKISLSMKALLPQEDEASEEVAPEVEATEAAETTEE